MLAMFELPKVSGLGSVLQAAEAEARQRALDEQRLRAEEAATAAQRLVEDGVASDWPWPDSWLVAFVGPGK